MDILERLYSCTKVVYTGWPTEFERFVKQSVDWNASPGWPWKEHYPTNRELFKFDGLRCDSMRLAMVEQAVRRRWNQLRENPVADPINVFVKPEPHKRSKVDKKAWRLISGVGLTDTLVDRILYGNWLDKLIDNWIRIPSKAGWTPSGGGYKWMAQTFRDRIPVSIDKSSWDWTVNEWHVSIILNFIPRMVVKVDEDWNAVYQNRMAALFGAGYPILKFPCKCEFVQLVDGIQKSGCLGTIGFNSIWQTASHIAIGGNPDDVFYSLGDDTAQEKPADLVKYVETLKKTGALVKEVEVGFPIKFGGHDFDDRTCNPSYVDKHMFNLLYLEDKVGLETLTSYQFLYALHDEGRQLIQDITLKLYGPEHILSYPYLYNWYHGYE